MSDTSETPLQDDFTMRVPPAALRAEAPNEGRRVMREDHEADFPLPADAQALPLRMPGQRFALLHLTHKAHRPRFHTPGFRLLGVFADEQSMFDHARKKLLPSNCSLWSTELHNFLVCCTSTEKQQDKQYNVSHLRKLQRFHDQFSSGKDFERRVARGESDRTSVGDSLFAREQRVYQRQQEEHERTRKDKGEPKIPKEASQLSSDVCLRLQNFAVVIVLRDLRDAVMRDEEEPEPAVSVLAVFEDKDTAIFYAKHTAHKAFPQYYVHIIDLYAWLFPETLDPEAVPEVYGKQTQDEIMRNRKDSMRKAESYEAKVQRWQQARVEGAAQKAENEVPSQELATAMADVTLEQKE